MALYVISVGGSLIVPDKIDKKFLKDFKELILKRINEGDRFILVAGGGKTARNYINAAGEVTDLDDEEKDWLGIHSTRLNAHLLRTIFKLYANPIVVKDFENLDLDFHEKILVGAGWKPGNSTDLIAVLLAEKFNAEKVINLSNIEYVYSDDPKNNPNAVKYEKISWKEFRKIVGDEWSPGMNAPFDPIASKKSEELGLEVAILKGSDIKNIENYLENKNFKGTIIK